MQARPSQARPFWGRAFLLFFPIYKYKDYRCLLSPAGHDWTRLLNINIHVSFFFQLHSIESVVFVLFGPGRLTSQPASQPVRVGLSLRFQDQYSLGLSLTRGMVKSELESTGFYQCEGEGDVWRYWHVSQFLTLHVSIFSFLRQQTYSPYLLSLFRAHNAFS